MKKFYFLALVAAAFLLALSPGASLANWGEQSGSYSGEQMNSMESGPANEPETWSQESPQAGTYEYQEAQEAGSLPGNPSNKVENRDLGETQPLIEGGAGNFYRPDIDTGP